MRTFLSVILVAVLIASASKGEAAEKPVRVLLVTGVDYVGHHWKETAPALRRVLEQDKQLDVRIVDDPAFLATPVIFDYDVLFLHFKNYDPIPRETEVRKNLCHFVEQGKGLVLFHFACGAFEDWPEFEKLAGRVWDKKKRGHDPHGVFTVEITAPQHPIAREMTSFEVVDELYTCLGGTQPIEVLATARSKVDGQEYPMAFVFSYGKGRVFHTLLGHDARAVDTPGVGSLLRRACLWTAGKMPQERKETE